MCDFHRDLVSLARQRDEARVRLDAILERTVKNKTMLKETLDLARYIDLLQLLSEDMIL